MLFSTAVFLLIAGLSPLIAFLYHRPALVPMICVLGLTIYTTAFLNLPGALYLRELEYRRRNIITSIGPAVNFTVTVTLALAGAGVWSPIAGAVAALVASGGVIAWAAPLRPRIRLNRAITRRFLRYGWPLWIAGVLGIATAWGGTAVISAVIGISALGYFALSQALAQRAFRLDALIGQTIFPVLCRAPDDLEGQRRAFTVTNRITVMWAGPIGFGLAIFAPDLVRFILGPKWEPAVALFVAQGFAVAVGSIGYSWDVFFRARAETRPTLIISAIGTAWVFLILLPVVVLGGLKGAAWAIATMGPIAVFARQGMMRRLFPGLNLFLNARREFLASGTAALLTLGLRWAVGPPTALLWFAVFVVLFLALSALMFVMVDRELLRWLIKELVASATQQPRRVGLPDGVPDLRDGASGFPARAGRFPDGVLGLPDDGAPMVDGGSGLLNRRENSPDAVPGSASEGASLRAAGGVVYVLERFPERSETFIQSELRQLRKLGVVPRIFAIQAHQDLDTDASDLPFRRLASVAQHPVRFLGASLRLAFRHPARLARVVALALRRPSRQQMRALAKSILLLDELGPDRPERIHAHFALVSASTAMLTAAAVGSRFSFTGHAYDLFVRPFDMERKLGAADVTLTVCEYNRRFIETTWPGLGHIEVVPCGVDVDRFHRTQPYRRDPFTIVAVGRLVEKKGFDFLIRACALLRDRGVSFRCRILGEGSERGGLERLIEELDLRQAVYLEGSVPPSAVRAALEGASVFCLPCVVASDGNRDSQPVVVKEAMAMGLPVVATAEVGIPEMVDEQTGWLVPPADAAALSCALEEVAVTVEERLVRMGAVARRRVEERFSLAACTGELVTCWERAVR
jgi:glycosyltransferase involved in cell wall biosynthesis/O-antigen/teichoic acid export membrane protein